MLLIAVFKGIRQWNMSCVSNVSQCIAVFLLWWLGEGARPRGSETPFISPAIQLCESVIVGVGFQREQRETEGSEPVSQCAWKMT